MTGPLDRLLAKLERVRRSGPDRAMACCPAHEDRTPSLSLRQLDDGRILIHCLSGCGATEVLDAIGLEFGDLYPERGEYKSLHQSVPPALQYARCVCRLAAADIKSGKRLTAEDEQALAAARRALNAWKAKENWGAWERETREILE